MNNTQPAGTVNIGRPGPFGNPAAINSLCPKCGEVHRDASSTLPCYKQMLWERLKSDRSFRQGVTSLSQKSLWCPGCGVGKPSCHGRILEAAAAWLKEPILFWSKAPTLIGRALSNFYPVDVPAPHLGITFPSSEHAYFWLLLVSDEVGRSAVLEAKTAAEAKKVASRYPQNDKENRRRECMMTALRWKFSSGRMRQLLLETYEKPLIHFAPWGDTYWGVDKTLHGENVQGHLLEELRSTL
jgi:ribA/ribD-fused uncharacterized protein